MNILLYDVGMPFDIETPYNEPLGGSEISALLLAKGLSEVGNSVVLLTTCSSEPKQEGKLYRSHVSHFYNYAQRADVIILNRHVPVEIMEFIGKKKIYYWSHDAYDQKNVQWMMNQDAVNMLDKILCVSEWQKNTFVNYMGVSSHKVSVLPNPIDISLYEGSTKRDENKLIFCSIPYKGLEVIGDIFNDVCIRSRRKLNLSLFSSMNLYGGSNDEYNNVYSKLGSIEGITINNVVSMAQLAYELSTASLYVHPCTYHETFGRVFIESMASGCIPVTVYNGANLEVIGNVVEGSNILNKNVYTNFVDSIVERLDNDLSWERDKCRKRSKSFDHIEIAKRFLNEVEHL